MQNLLTFLSIVLAIYGSINAYIYIRLRQSIPRGSWFRPIFPWVFWFVAASFFVGQFLEYRQISIVSDALTWIGAFWLGAMTWFFLAALLIDLIRLIDHFTQFLPRVWYENGVITKEWIASIASAIILISMFLGYWNAQNIRVRPLAITIDKSVPGIDSLHIAAISDMHMGSMVRREMVQQMVDKINSIHPDLVLMAGDQVDGNPYPAIALNLGNILREIKSKYGVYAITGNHEYIGGAERTCAYLEAHGVNMIRDSSVEVAGGIYIVGREDRSEQRFSHVPRKTLAELVSSLDKSKPIIVMDHQPYHLEEAEENGIDLQLSGHTHDAQIWPWNYITEAVYEVSWGYKKKGNTNIYVSCGAGTWGPPIRIGNTPEIMDITLHFRQPPALHPT